MLSDQRSPFPCPTKSLKCPKYRINPPKGRRAKQSSFINRVRNGSAYNQALKQRGSVTLWFAPEAVAAWNYQWAAQRGAQFVYWSLAFDTALTLQQFYHLPLCQTEGFKVFKTLADPSHPGPIEPIIALCKDAKVQQHGNGKAHLRAMPRRHESRNLY